ncbi:MAG: DUF2793 domain-containing protein [Rhodobacteraceae bacterium]|nr:DUF2793 domain-containing protein [Paracoccaceae bacterium]
MAETSQLNLPLLSPSQAQKHVTVNEALARLDGLTQMVLASRTATVPPLSAEEGTSYAVPAGAVNDWAGWDGAVATFANGGWVFAVPRRGWRGFVADESVTVLHDGNVWQAGALALSPNGAGTFLKVDEFDHVIGAGASSTTTGQIASGVMVIAVTARVLVAVTGTLTAWQLGTAGAADRFGSGLGLGAGSYARGMLSAPMTYWGAAPLLLTATGGEFAGGTVRIAVHSLDLSLPGM